MIVFWIVAGVLAAAAAGLVLTRAARATGVDPDPTAELYRRQIAELDDLASQGLIAEADRKAAYAEAGRRLLAAAERGPSGWNAGPTPRGAVLAAAASAPALALVLYLTLGAPGVRDQPFAARLAHWRASPPEMLDPPELAAVLQALVRERPADVEGLRFLAIAQGEAQNPGAAIRALRQAIRIAPQRVDLWEMLGAAQMVQAGGDVTPEVQDSFRQALRLDPSAMGPRFHLARAKIAGGDLAGGLADWRALLADIPAADPRHAQLESAIAEAQAGPQAGSKAPAGPTPEQMQMIRGMVSGLAQRLQAQPDDAQGWVRLVRAYAVLGETTERDAALKAAHGRFAGRPDVLKALDDAAAAERMQ